MKTCSRCKEKKSFDQYAPNKQTKSGYDAYCRPCKAEKRKQYYEQNKERERTQNRQWHLEHRPWLDPTKREYHNAWRRAADRTIEYADRRALEINAEGRYTLEEWYALCEKYGNKCLGCGRPDVKLTQDHVVPLSRGGSNWITNIQPLCMPCNASKGVRTIDYRS